MISKRISELSCDHNMFFRAAREYNQTLHKSGFNENIAYKQIDRHLSDMKVNKRYRKRNITGFNLPYSQNVATNIGKEFFSLLY